MDVLIDSDLSDHSDVEINEPGPIRPYMYAPLARLASESKDSGEETHSDSSSSDVDIEDEIPDFSSWCQCGHCVNMPSLSEARCCKTSHIIDSRSEGLDFITQHEGFIVNCLNIHVLEVAYYDHIMETGPLEENHYQRIHVLYRHLAYRRFTRWIYGLLGKKIRKVIPACTVAAIRTAFPSQQYCGFRYPD